MDDTIDALVLGADLTQSSGFALVFSQMQTSAALATALSDLFAAPAAGANDPAIRSVSPHPPTAILDDSLFILHPPVR